MFITAVGSVLAKPPPIPHTLSSLGVRVDMLIYTLKIRTLAVFCEKPALWHLLQVVFVQKFAGFALFAEASEPVFANDRLFRASVFKGTVVAAETDPFEVIFAHVTYLSSTVKRPLVVYSEIIPDKRLKV
jgi:hypothetical protein